MKSQLVSRNIMKLFSLTLLLLLLSVSNPASPFAAYGGGVYAARIPEHTCHKVIGLDKCDVHKCRKECSKKPFAEGACKGSNCVCTFYCKQPPM